jgi:hypothetical protein
MKHKLLSIVAFCANSCLVRNYLGKEEEDLMTKAGFLNRRFVVVIVAGFVAAFAATAARAQSFSQDEESISPTDADKAAAQQATRQRQHATPAHIPQAWALRGAENFTGHSASESETTDESSDRDLVRYPADMIYHGGPVVEYAESHAIYMLPNGKCLIARCWGNPEGLLRDLGESEFIHVTDQYVGLSARERYTVGRRAKVSFTPQKLRLRTQT